MSCFDKWHFSALRRAASGCTSSGTCGDSLLPTLPSADLVEMEELLRLELEGEGFGQSAAAAIALWLRKKATKAAVALTRRLRKLSDDGENDSPVSAVAAAKDGLIEIRCGETKGLLLNTAQLEKLRRLFGSADEQAFLRATLLVLMRYQTLDGGGFQCSLPQPVFSCLEEMWGGAPRTNPSPNFRVWMHVCNTWAGCIASW